LAVSFLAAACGPASPPEASRPQKSEEPRTDRQSVKRALGNIQSHLTDLEGRLRISSAETWSHEASAAQHDLGNIQLEVGTLSAGSLNVGGLEALLSELEGRLRSASAENWSQNSSAARHLVGSIRMELQSLSRGF
jgi:hypothetical protein